MISRVWHGWTKRENADAYELLTRYDNRSRHNEVRTDTSS